MSDRSSRGTPDFDPRRERPMRPADGRGEDAHDGRRPSRRSTQYSDEWSAQRYPDEARAPGGRDRGQEVRRRRDDPDGWSADGRYQGRAYREGTYREGPYGDAPSRETSLRETSYGEAAYGETPFRETSSREGRYQEQADRDDPTGRGDASDGRPPHGYERYDRSAYALQNRQNRRAPQELPIVAPGRRAQRAASESRQVEEPNRTHEVDRARRTRPEQETRSPGWGDRQPERWPGRSRLRSADADRHSADADRHSADADRHSADADRRHDQDRPEPEERASRSGRYTGRLGPLTAATAVLRRIRLPRRGEPADPTNPQGMRIPADDRKDLNNRSDRPSFFDMESEPRRPARTHEEPKRIPTSRATFPSLAGTRTVPSSNRPQSFRQPPRRRRPRLALIAVFVVAILAIVGAVYALEQRGTTDAAAGATTSPAASSTATAGSGDSAQAEEKTTTGAEEDVELGLFRGTSPSALSDFGDWLGREPSYAVDYSTRATWDQIASPTYMLSSWRDSGYRMVYAVAMLPTRDDSVSLAAGADGDYNSYFQTLAENLVAYDQGDSILRLGWEFNVSGWSWHPTYDDSADFIAYWRQIVRTMRAVPGAENLEFDWNVNNGGDTYDSTVFYPGSKFVDYIGVDLYDTSWVEDSYPYPTKCDSTCRRTSQETAWANAVDATFGLSFWSDFAQGKGKPLSFPEWGMWDRPDGHGGADNPYFIQQMYEFIDDPANNVAYQAYFDYNTDSRGTHAFEDLPKGAKRYLKLFKN